MGNCIVTELNSSISDNSLPVFGTIDIEFDLTNVPSVSQQLFATASWTYMEALDYNTGATLIAKKQVNSSFSVSEWGTLAGKHFILRCFNRYSQQNTFSIDGYSILGNNGKTKWYLADIIYQTGLTRLFSQSSGTSHPNRQIIGDLNVLANSASANTITRIDLRGDGMTGTFDFLLDDVNADTPTLKFPNLTELLIYSWGSVTPPSGFTTAQIRQKYLDAGVTTVEFN